MLRFILIVVGLLAGLGLVSGMAWSDTPDPAPSAPLVDTLSKGAAPDSMTDILDIKPPEIIGFDMRIIYAALALIGLLVLLALLFFLVDRLIKKRKNKQAAKASPLPPDVQAFTELDRLEKDGLDDARDFYFRLTAILKVYLDGRFGVNAPEMTTEELGPVISTLAVPQPLAGNLKDLLRRSDPVKFAGLTETRDRLSADLAFAQSFIHQTRPVASETEPSENEEA